jgi:hypoxanthine phosphoribosyltransferase
MPVVTIEPPMLDAQLEMIVRGTRRLVKFIRQKGIATIVAVGPSSVYSARAVAQAFAKKYPKAERPEVHALGGSIETHFKDLLSGEARTHDPEALKKAAEAIRETRPGLLKRLDRPVLLFDDVLDTGRTLRGAQFVFKDRLNAREVHTAVLSKWKTYKPVLFSPSINVGIDLIHTRLFTYPERSKRLEWLDLQRSGKRRFPLDPHYELNIASSRSELARIRSGWKRVVERI